MPFEAQFHEFVHLVDFHDDSYSETLNLHPGSVNSTIMWETFDHKKSSAEPRRQRIIPRTT